MRTRLELLLLSVFTLSYQTMAAPSTDATILGIDGMGFSQVSCLSSEHDGYEKKVILPVKPSQTERYLEYLAANPSSYANYSKFEISKKTVLIKKELFLCENIKIDKVGAYLNANGLPDAYSDSESTYSGQEFMKKVVLLKNSPFESANRLDVMNDESLDDGLKNLILRVLPIYSAEGTMSSGFLAGPDCSNVITAKHNVYAQDDSGTKKSESFSVGRIRGPNKLVDVKPRIPNWIDADDGHIFKIAKPLKVYDCEKTKFLIRAEIKKNIEKLNNCRLVGFPNLVAEFDGKTKSLGKSVLEKNGEYLKSNSRAISSCAITDVAEDGVIIHNCSSSPGASGGPIFCEFNSKWHYVATNIGDACAFNGERANANICYDPNKLSEYDGDKYSSTARHGRAGAFEDDPI